ncbi:hypothetical protein [Methylibium petroleiphilum]|uniref:Carboxypeptidase regulatory-like domain-containing protein n=1 Tax=Methylibium petroleiphilum (strain ATCC BAA-1232 / LMG 22953 / PM1) TaxID=420662 RepID=A2SLN9_METPP|nr:hypothetical protein [Methylibium petroleiphilum]ABM96478.1 conserved hypothetical protein [Methylibium petroleiphilum PM1]
MNSLLRTMAGALSMTAALWTGAIAQPAGDAPPVPRVERAGGISYVNGGAGEEARAVIDRLSPDFALRNVFSGQGGQYVVAERVTLQNTSGGEPVVIRDAGPILMISLPPGRYTMEAMVGGQSQRKIVQVGSAPMRVDWRWPGA